MHEPVNLGWEFIFWFLEVVSEKSNYLLVTDQTEMYHYQLSVCVYERHIRAVEDGKLKGVKKIIHTI